MKKSEIERNSTFTDKIELDETDLWLMHRRDLEKPENKENADRRMEFYKKADRIKVASRQASI